MVTVHAIDNPYSMYDVGYIGVSAFIEVLVKQGNQIVADAYAKAERAGVYVHSVVIGDPIGTLDTGTAVEQMVYNVGVQAPALGTRGCRGFQRLLLGSVAESIAHWGILPALLVHTESTETSYVPTESLSNTVIA